MSTLCHESKYNMSNVYHLFNLSNHRLYNMSNLSNYNLSKLSTLYKLTNYSLSHWSTLLVPRATPRLIADRGCCACWSNFVRRAARAHALLGKWGCGILGNRF